MGAMRKVGRLSAIACSVLVALAFILPTTMTGRGAGLADGVIAAGYFLVLMGAAAIVAIVTAIWGKVEASRSGGKFEGILLVPLAIVAGGVVILFVSAALRGAL